MPYKKNILIGVSGSIAAYKMPDLARILMKKGYNVQVSMTKNAMEFITPFTFETLTKSKCLVDTFDKNFQYSVEHVSVAQWADVVIIAPASANIIGKLANGIADDMLTTIVTAAIGKKIIAPAMNHYMYHNTIVQENIEKLKRNGWIVIPPEKGMLANGDTGDGKMPPVSELMKYIEQLTAHEEDLVGKRILVTAGATREKIDPVRYITNYSTGKMGCAIAEAARQRGAEVTLVAGAVSCELPPFVKVIKAISADDMYEAVMREFPDNDMVIKSAAVADFTPETTADQKIKKHGSKSMEMNLRRTKDILKSLGQIKKDGQVICGFSMETEHLLENSQKKLVDKNADMICANSLNEEGAGFGTDTNIITVITAEGADKMPVMSKSEAANRILDKLLEISKNKYGC